MKNIDYLDLAIKDNPRNTKTTLEGHQIGCNFENKFKHILHSEEKQLNSIVDLIINLGQKQEIIESNNKKLKDKEKTQAEIINYLKFQSNQIIAELKEINRKINELKQIFINK